MHYDSIYETSIYYCQPLILRSHYVWHNEMNMQSVKEIITGSIISPYRGGVKSCEMVREQIRERWGDACAEEFDPTRDAAPYSFWLSAGFQVRKCQKALKSITFVDGKDEKGEIKKIMRTVNLFHRRQVEKIA